MRDLYERVRGDLDLTRLAQFLEDVMHYDNTAQANLYASQVREMRDRLLRGPPVMASDLDIEQFLAVDMLKQIRRMFKIPDEQAIIPFLNEMLNQWSREPDGIQSLDI